MKNFTLKLLITTFAFVSLPSYAVDATNRFNTVGKFGNWEVIEFSFPGKLLYRISAMAIKNERETITFDLTNDNCEPAPAILVTQLTQYIPELDHSRMPYAYKIPGQAPVRELVTTEMAKGDKYAFIGFNGLTVAKLLKPSSKGRLSLWVPVSSEITDNAGDKNNAYFALDGIQDAYKSAVQFCKANK